MTTFPERIPLLESLQFVWQIADEDNDIFSGPDDDDDDDDDNADESIVGEKLSMLDSDGSEEEEEEEGTTGGVLRTRLLSSTESTDSMLNTEESSEKVRSTPSGTEDDTGINIVIEKDETLIAKTTRSGDAIIYGIVRGYSPDGHQYDLLSNWEVEYEDDLFEEEEDDDNDDDDDDDKDGQTKYEYLNDREVTEACHFSIHYQRN